MIRLSPDWLHTAPTAPVLAALTAEGADARVVGGAVRDTLLGRPVADVDMATPDTPEDVTRLLDQAGIKWVPTGLHHGTVTAVVDHQPVEITTLREDTACDGRHAEVVFGTDWAVDARRRDFTINALSMGPDGTVYDYTDGIADIRAGRLRFIGTAEDRIKEDYLRILRFYRFCAQLDLPEPDPAALAACAALKDGLHRISVERIAVELKKLLAASAPLLTVEEMAAASVLTTCLPRADIGPAARTLLTAPAPALIRLAALLPPGTRQATARALKLSGEEIQRLAACDRLADQLTPEMDPVDLLEALYDHGRETLADVALLSQAASNTPGDWEALKQRIDAFIPLPLPLTGRDLMDAGIPEGPQIGIYIRRARRLWLEQGRQSDRDDLLKAVLAQPG